MLPDSAGLSRNQTGGTTGCAKGMQCTSLCPGAFRAGWHQRSQSGRPDLLCRFWHASCNTLQHEPQVTLLGCKPSHFSPFLKKHYPQPSTRQPDQQLPGISRKTISPPYYSCKPPYARFPLGSGHFGSECSQNLHASRLSMQSGLREVILS